MTRDAQPRLYLVLLAGGQSTRARRSDSCAPKQFREIDGEMLFVHGLRELVQAPGVSRAVVVVPDAWRPTAESAVAAMRVPLLRSLVSTAESAVAAADLAVPCDFAAAGRHRTASAWSALSHLATLPDGQGPRADDLVAVHDAARPFATRHLLARLAVAAARRGAAVPGVAVPDTIVQLAESLGDPVQERPVAAYLERQRLVAVQTPQVCRWQDLHDAHAWANAEERSFTDDGGLLAARGLSPVVVMGEAENWKITLEDDWQRAAVLLRERGQRG